MADRLIPGGVERSESRYAPEVLAAAKKAALELIKNGQKIATFQFGHEQGTLYISADAGAVVGSEEVVVEGKTFYIGLFFIDSK